MPHSLGVHIQHRLGAAASAGWFDSTPSESDEAKAARRSGQGLWSSESSLYIQPDLL